MSGEMIIHVVNKPAVQPTTEGKQTQNVTNNPTESVTKASMVDLS